MRGSSLFYSLLLALPVCAQNTGSVRGTVTLEANGNPLHNATVRLAPGGRSVETNESGIYEFRGVAPGNYQVFASMRNLSDEKQSISVAPGQTVTADFKLRVAAVRQEVTVTATGEEQTALESFESTATLESYELLTKTASTSLGEALDNEPGIAKRSFGPGTSRPVIRGFDGDRVLILGDGIRTGTLSSQSGDHGEPADISNAERIEVVRGPATLMYGSGALGGVVNVLTPFNQLHEHPHEGIRGHITGMGGTTNSMGGGSASFQYGSGKWSLFGQGGGLRTGDYNTPLGIVPNSASGSRNAGGGLGRYGDKLRWSFNVNTMDGRYGVPSPPEANKEHATHTEGGQHEIVQLSFRRHNLRLNTALVNLGPALETFTNTLNYSDWNHNEIADGQVGTQFFNKQFNWHGIVQQQRRGILTGSFGAWVQHRDFKSLGKEALAPPTTQNSAALFAVERLNFERFSLQAGARWERNRYNPTDDTGRTFDGFSGSAGINVKLATNTAGVLNFTHSYRAPALEELYNRGPHAGNAAFEVGDRNLRGERGAGIEASIRNVSKAVRAEINAFYYGFTNFVFLAFQQQFEDGLPVAQYRQADSRYLGADARVDFRLQQSLWLNLGFDVVDAQLKSGTPLPRIPPVRGKIGFDFRRGGLSLKPEVVLANRQHQIYLNETPTAGYAAINVTGLYTIAHGHAMHTFSATVFNATDRLYRNHLSFIKDFAPEIGAGVRVAYTLNFF